MKVRSRKYLKSTKFSSPLLQRYICLMLIVFCLQSRLVSVNTTSVYTSCVFIWKTPKNEILSPAWNSINLLENHKNVENDLHCCVSKWGEFKVPSNDCNFRIISFYVSLIIRPWNAQLRCQLFLQNFHCQMFLLTFFFHETWIKYYKEFCFG